MHHYKIVPFLKLLIQGRGMPLHQLCTQTNISEDDLLDILSRRRKVSASELTILCEVLKSNQIGASTPKPFNALAPNLQIKLNQLRILDSALLDSIMQLHKLAIKQDLQREAPEVDSKWLASLSQLMHLYTGYHTDVQQLMLKM